MDVFLQNIYITSLFRADSLFARYTKGFSNYGRIITNLTHLLGQAESILRNPKRYTREAVLLISAIFLLFLIVSLMVVIAMAVKRRIVLRRTYRSVGRKFTAEELRKVLIIGGIVVISISALLTTATSEPTICARCHSISRSYNGWERSAHKTIKCVGCHYEPGLLGYALGTVHGAENLLAHVFKNPEPPRAAVSNTTCLQCHGNITNGIVMGEREIRVRHKDFLGGGILCTNCHAGVSHGAKSSKTFAMNNCTGCHNGKLASSECKTCHEQDIAYKPHQTLDDWPKVKSIPLTCIGCHSDATRQRCIDCHGLELPHSEEFKQHHPMKAEPSQGHLCYKCHWSKGMADNRMCGCHDSGSVHGLPDQWYYGHREAASETGAGCRCHYPKFCSRCHDEEGERLHPNREGWSTRQ